MTGDAPAVTRPHYRSFRWTISEVADSTTAAGRVQLAEITLLGKHDFQPLETAFITIIPLVFIAAGGVIVGVRKSKNYLFTYPLLERLMIAYCFMYLISIPLAIATPLTTMVTGPLFALGVPAGVLALWLTKDVALPGVFSGTKYRTFSSLPGSFSRSLCSLCSWCVEGRRREGRKGGRENDSKGRRERGREDT